MAGGGKLPSYSIRSKILLLLVIAFLPSLGMIISWGLERRDQAIGEAKENALLLVESLAAQQEQIAMGTEQMLSTLAQLPQVQQKDAQACNRLFRELKDRHPSYSTMGAVMPDGELFSRADPFEPGTINIGDQKHVRDVLNSFNFSTGEYIVGKVSKVPTIHYSYPVFDRDGKLSCVVIAGFRLDAYARFLEKTRLPKGSVVAIADHRGMRLYRQPVSSAAAEGQPIPHDTIKRISGSDDKGTFELISEDGTERIYSFKQLRLKDGSQPYLYMIVGIPKKAIVQRANQEMRDYLSALGIIALIAVALAWFFGNRFLADPFRQLVAATRALRQREAELKEAQRLSHIGSWHWDAKTDVTAGSDELLRIYGFDPAKDLMPDFREQRGRCYPVEDWERLNEAVQESLQTGVGYELDMQAIRNGQHIWITMRSEVVRDADGLVVGLRGTVQDITERKRSEIELNDSHQEKVALLKEVHHRVKNNLQVVVSLLGLQAGCTKNREALEVLEDTRNRVRSMALLHEVLYRSGNLSRISFANYIGDLCRQLVISFEQPAQRIKVETRVEDIGMPMDKAVPCGLILNELVTNALKHAFPDGRSGLIVVELGRTDGQKLLLRVYDDGVGLSPDIDLENTSTLGLQLVFELAYQLLGHVTLDRPAKGGTVFCVVFPFDGDTH